MLSDETRDGDTHATGELGDVLHRAWIARIDVYIYNFPNSLNEMGRGCEFVARIFATQRLNKLCDAGIVFVRKRLVRPARFLCCAVFDAAMHKRKSRNFFEETISTPMVNRRNVAALHRCNHFPHHFERSRSLKTRRRLVACAACPSSRARHEFSDDSHASEDRIVCS